MEFLARGVPINVFKKKDFIDKNDSNNSRVGKWTVQYMAERDMGEGLGVQMVLEDITLPEDVSDSRVKSIQEARVNGEVVEIPVRFYVKDNKKEVGVFGV